MHQERRLWQCLLLKECHFKHPLSAASIRWIPVLVSYFDITPDLCLYCDITSVSHMYYDFYFSYCKTGVTKAYLLVSSFNLPRSA